jgi:hypothetical protein
MHISIDNETNPMEMHHIAVALQRIAAERGYVAQVQQEFPVGVDVSQAEAETAVSMIRESALHTHSVAVVEVPPVTVSVDEPVRAPADMTDAEHFQSCIDAGTVIITSSVTTDANLDVNGLPWDARIHAGSRERNTDGSWRVRRKPKTVEQDEWDATLARVAAELTDLMAIPVSPGAVADAAAETRKMIESLGDTLVEPLSDAEVDAFVEIVQGVTEPVVVAPPVTIAPPVVVPPVTAVAPPITVDKPAIETFAQLMSWLTSRTPKDEAAKPAMVTRVNEILAANGLTTLQQLGQRADLIPQVLVQFIEAFGE